MTTNNSWVISFDPNKRAETLSRRGLDFADAARVFEGTTVTEADRRKDYGEDRFVTIGTLDGRCVVLVWTPRDGGRRIISMRKASADEQRSAFPG